MSGLSYPPGSIAWRRTLLALGVLFTSTACERGPQAPSVAPAADGWHEFEGTANLAGTRRTLGLGGGRGVALVDLRGSLLLSGPARPGVGFSSEFLALTDSATGLVGRSAWTDEEGDKVYSELRGTGTATDNRIEGTIVGGTGRFAGAEGTYEFTWQYVLQAEDGSIQGRTVGLHGRVRAGSQPGGKGGPR